MANQIANPVIRLDFKTANFLKGITSAKSATRSFFRDIKKTTQRGMKGSNASLFGGLSIAKGALIGFASFAIVSVFSKILNTVKRVFTEIPRFILQAGIEMQNGLAEVRKAVDLTGGGISELRTRFVELSRAGPLTTKALLEAAAAGARMGIALDETGNVAKDATQRIFEFARVISIADVAIEDLDATELARGLGRLSKLFKLSTDQTKNLASSLNSAAQSSSALASEILNAVRRAGSAAKQFGFTAAETIAIQTTMLELGRTVEITGSSFEKMIATIAKPEKFAKFAKFVGLTKDEFAKLFDENPVEAFRQIFKALGDIKGPRKAEAALTELFGSSIRVLGSIRALSSGVTLLDKNLKVARTSFKDGTSIFKEFDIAAATVDSKLVRLKNNIRSAATTFFGKLTPSIESSIGSLIGFTDSLNDAAKDPAIASFFSELIEDISLLAAEVGKFGVKFIRLFIGEFKKGADVGFFKTLAGAVQRVTALLKPQQFSAFISAFKLGLGIALGFFQAITDITTGFFKIVDITTGWIRKLTGGQPVLSALFDTVLKIKNAFSNIFKIDFSSIKNIKNIFSALADFIAAKFRFAILGGKGNEARLKLFRGRLEAILSKTAEGQEKKTIKRKDKKRKKEAKKDDAIEVEKIPKKPSRRKRKPGIFLPSQARIEFEEKARKRQKKFEETQRGLKGKVTDKTRFTKRAAEIGALGETEPSIADFAKRGARGAIGEKAAVFAETERENAQKLLDQAKRRTEILERSAKLLEAGNKEIESMLAALLGEEKLVVGLSRLKTSLGGARFKTNR